MRQMLMSANISVNVLDKNYSVLFYFDSMSAIGMKSGVSERLSLDHLVVGSREK